MRTAESVLLTCCPPAPVERYVSMRRSCALITIPPSSVLSSSGITSTSAKDVCRRWFWSNGEMRTRRCTPCSDRSRPYARGPRTRKVALFKPASSPRDSSTISVSNPRRSAHLRYMRSSISTQSWASTPPWPTEMVMTALWFAYGSVKSRSSSCARTSLVKDARSSASCFSSSGSPCASWSSSTRSRARLSSRSHVAISSRFSEASRAIWPARRGSSHTPGLVSSASSSSALLALPGRSKVLLELQDPVQEFFGVEFSVHYLPWHLLYFLPDPHQHGSLRPILAAAPAGTAAEAAPNGAARRCCAVAPRPAPLDPSTSPGPLSVTWRTSGGAGGGGASRWTCTR